jgi:sulfur carrier protein
MKVTINGQKKDIADAGITVEKLLFLEEVKNPDTVAVQYNGEFLNREAYGTTFVQEGDDVEFVYFLGGGRGAAR